MIRHETLTEKIWSRFKKTTLLFGYQIVGLFFFIHSLVELVTWLLPKLQVFLGNGQKILRWTNKQLIEINLNRENLLRQDQ